MNISLQKINKNALRVCEVLIGRGFQAYIVGGCVRDLLLGHEPKDWDICTNAKPEVVQNLFEKTYPTGLQHGTITVAMNEEHFEVTTYRVEGEYLDGRRPSEVKFVSKIEEDLARRDLTINAIAYNPISDQLVDPFGGVRDLENGVIRCVNNPIDRLNEDGLRIMRVARFAARFGYQVGALTEHAMRQCLETLKKVSVERIADELKKTLMTSNPLVGIRLLKETGALEVACPLLSEYYQDRIHDYCYWEYGGDVETRLATLFMFVPINKVKEQLLALKLSTKEIKRVMFILSAHEKFMSQFGIPNKLYDTDEFYIGLVSMMKNESPDTYEYSLEQFNIFLRRHEFLPRIAKLQVFARNELQLNGNDLLSLGFAAGPNIKNCLNEAYGLILKNPEKNNAAELRNFAMGFLEKTTNL